MITLGSLSRKGIISVSVLQWIRLVAISFQAYLPRLIKLPQSFLNLLGGEFQARRRLWGGRFWGRWWKVCTKMWIIHVMTAYNEENVNNNTCLACIGGAIPSQ